MLSTLQDSILTLARLLPSSPPTHTPGGQHRNFSCTTRNATLRTVFDGTKLTKNLVQIQTEIQKQILDTIMFSLRNLTVTSSTSRVHHSVFFSQFKSRVGNILTKSETLWITLNIDGEPTASKSHTHPSHWQTSRLLTSSLSLGVPVPRSTQCM